MNRFLKSFACFALAACLLMGLACCANTPVSDSKYNDGVIGERKGGSDGDLAMYEDGVVSGDRSYSKDSKALYAEMPASASEAMADGEYYGEEEGIYDGEENGIAPQAGLLTAGEIRDAKDLKAWQLLCGSEEWLEFENQRHFHTNNVILVHVQDADGNPVFNQAVELRLADANDLIYTARTDIEGNANLIYGDASSTDQLRVRVGDSEQEYAEKLTFTAAGSAAPKALDLMLMIDTTGSMGDELEYLKAELVDMVTRISEADQAFSIRTSVNFYRDEGDDYVVKYFDFREDIQACLEQIKEQYADGGGDYPEAVHTALENAVTGHKWREDAVKLCFMVLDAPPHDESEIQGINAQLTASLKAAAEQGIRIIPVASSGIDKDTEFILRSFALMTGGTYIFLTNDSGIGGDHIAPSADQYTVEPLNECMIRVVCEYCGIAYEAPAPTPVPTDVPAQNGQQ